MTPATDEEITSSRKPAAPDDSMDAPGPSPADEPETWGWTRRQRLGLGMLTSALIALLIIQAIRRPYRLDDPLVIVNGNPVHLPVAIDPNTASAGSLSRIPGVSEALAGAIVEYREVHKSDTPEGIVFQNFEDLARIPKIRKKTLDALRVALAFPGDATRPAPSPHGLKPAVRLPATTEPDEDIGD